MAILVPSWLIARSLYTFLTEQKCSHWVFDLEKMKQSFAPHLLILSTFIWSWCYVDGFESIAYNEIINIDRILNFMVEASNDAANFCSKGD